MYKIICKATNLNVCPIRCHAIAEMALFKNDTEVLSMKNIHLKHADFLKNCCSKYEKQNMENIYKVEYLDDFIDTINQIEKRDDICYDNIYDFVFSEKNIKAEWIMDETEFTPFFRLNS